MRPLICGSVFQRIQLYLDNPDAPGGSALAERRTVAVTLGTSGEMAVLAQTADNRWWMGDAQASSGSTTVTSANGNEDMLVLSNGMWTAESVPLRVQVRLGDSNFWITAARAEDGTWLRGSSRLTDGMTIATPAGTTYRLNFVNGMWVGTEVNPTAMPRLTGPLLAPYLAEAATWPDKKARQAGDDADRNHSRPCGPEDGLDHGRGTADADTGVQAGWLGLPVVLSPPTIGPATRQQPKPRQPRRRSCERGRGANGPSK